MAIKDWRKKRNWKNGWMNSKTGSTIWIVQEHDGYRLNGAREPGTKRYKTLGIAKRKALLYMRKH